MSRRADPQLEATFADAGADLDELKRLRLRIHELRNRVQEGDGGDEPDPMTEAASKAFEIVDILVEEGILKTRHRSAEGSDPTKLLAIVQANVDYLQAALRAFSP